MAAATNIQPAFPTIITLSDEGAVDALARRARLAMLSFVNDGPMWDKRGVAEWLAFEYAPLTKEAPGSEATTPRARTIFEPKLTAVVGDARKWLMGLLRLSYDGHSASACAWRMIKSGLVAPCEDSRGRERGWMPIALPRMRLRERVLSLWAVDYLAHDDEYSAHLAICNRCGLVDFDAFSRARGACRAHTSPSKLPRWEQEHGSETRIRIR